MPTMRSAARFPSVLLLATFATAVLADEYPPRKPGEWEIATTGEIDALKTKMCIDKDTDHLFREHLAHFSLFADICDHKVNIKVEGQVVTAETQCKSNKSAVTASSVTQFDGDTAFHAETKWTFDPAIMGKTGGVMIEDGKWLGPCLSGMEPGDFIMNNGVRMNIRTLAAMKKL